jgi:putative transposase
MKASKFSDAQKAFILKQGNDGMQPPEMRRLKQLEDENSKLKKIVADLSLDREMLQDVIRRKL